jgi:hypothetical protein
MFLKSSLATFLLAATFCPLAPAKYNEPQRTAAIPAVSRQVSFQQTVTFVSDYATAADENDAEEQEQVGGADLTLAVWYHTPEVPIIFSDVAYHKKHRSKKKSAAIVGGTAAAGAVVGGLAGGVKGAVAGGAVGAGAGYLYDRNTKKK